MISDFERKRKRHERRMFWLFLIQSFLLIVLIVVKIFW